MEIIQQCPVADTSSGSQHANKSCANCAHLLCACASMHIRKHCSLITGALSSWLCAKQCALYKTSICHTFPSEEQALKTLHQSGLQVCLCLTANMIRYTNDEQPHGMHLRRPDVIRQVIWTLKESGKINQNAYVRTLQAVSGAGEQRSQQFTPKHKTNKCVKEREETCDVLGSQFSQHLTF